MMRRVVITGMGIYSCLGTSKDEVRDSLFAGKSGIIFDAQRKDIGFRSALTGMVEEPNLKGLLDRRQRKSMAQQCNYAFVSANEALEQAKIDADFLAKNEMGIIFGNDSSSKAVIDSVDGVGAKGDTTLLGSGSIFQAMNCPWMCLLGYYGVGKTILLIERAEQLSLREKNVYVGRVC